MIRGNRESARQERQSSLPRYIPEVGGLYNWLPVERTHMAGSGAFRHLLGRRKECEELDRLLLRTRAGQSGVLVVSGEPGVGKSALLEYAMASASGFQVARAAGVESEMELPFAALQQLCGSMLGRLDRLPSPQRGALEVAFGLHSGDAPSRYLVGLAVSGHRTRLSCWAAWCTRRWTSQYATRLWPRREVIRSRCWSCHVE